jgi:hypothetical protein
MYFSMRGYFILNRDFELSVGEARKYNLGSMYSKPGCHVVPKFFRCQRIPQPSIYFCCHVIRKPRALKLRAVTYMKAKLTWIKQFFFSTWLWSIFSITFSHSSSPVDRKLMSRKF